jgi:membrane protease YdiL (CAAX protease family)
MGVAYERTRRLGVPMTMHALFNLGNVVVGMAMHPR